MTKAAVSAVTKERISQSDVPGCSIEKAIRIAQAIADNYALKGATPLQVAMALGVQPTSGSFRLLTGASIAYGLTKGGYNSAMIELEPLGRRIVKPLEEGDDLTAKRQAFLKPRVIGEFLTKYNGAALPKDIIAKNVLSEMGVPPDRSGDVFATILEGASALGFIHGLKDKQYVMLDNTVATLSTSTHAPTEVAPESEVSPATLAPILVPDRQLTTDKSQSIGSSDQRLKRVFITHGKNKGFIEPIKKLLTYGELQAVVAAEQSTVSQPVPEKVMEAMRSCGAAIIHVEDEQRIKDSEGAEHVILNENVLIEIGAAMALYGRRFVLVKKDGVKMPSNLQGLYEVRYAGEGLDGNATMELLDVINDMKKRPLPTEKGATDEGTRAG